MKKLIVLLFAFAVFIVLTAQSVFASGDKVRGEEGDGSVCMIQVMDPQSWNW